VQLEELDFELPAEAIAQRPASPRDSCRLMHLRAGGDYGHHLFTELPRLLRPGDVVVFNDSKVLPARVMAYRPGGGQTEVLFLRPTPTAGRPVECWEALVRPSKRLHPGAELQLADGATLSVMQSLGEGRWSVSAPSDVSMIALMQANGRLPLPPYIRSYPEDPLAYQTVYASVPGSAAAPTAGLHFTQRLLLELRRSGIQIAYVTLHVGLDTFLPIRESEVERHPIHSETYEVAPEALAKVEAARVTGGHVVAVGTTTARVLETLAGLEPVPTTSVAPVRGTSSIYITPGYKFRSVDALLTNFHLPRSTVLALTMAFAGVQRLRRAYAEAIAVGYRFFTFGDAMLIDGPTVHARVDRSSYALP
jgi:S-adenosylmethionine:tRNA ribosyltransferase-isomerase